MEIVSILTLRIFWKNIGFFVSNNSKNTEIDDIKQKLSEFNKEIDNYGDKKTFVDELLYGFSQCVDEKWSINNLEVIETLYNIFTPEINIETEKKEIIDYLDINNDDMSY